MTDKELLELAAKACGLNIIEFAEDWDKEGQEIARVSAGSGLYTEWNPLNYDGDALRLAVTLKLFVDLTYENKVCGWVLDYKSGICKTIEEEASNDPRKATRRAIVRAAAEIGKQKE
jgi:hypothetical protein